MACLDLKDKMSISYPGKYCLETFSGRLKTVAGNDDLGVLDGLSSATHGARSVVTAATDNTRATAIILIIFASGLADLCIQLTFTEQFYQSVNRKLVLSLSIPSGKHRGQRGRRARASIAVNIGDCFNI